MFCSQLQDYIVVFKFYLLACPHGAHEDDHIRTHRGGLYFLWSLLSVGKVLIKILENFLGVQVHQLVAIMKLNQWSMCSNMVKHLKVLHNILNI